MDYLEIAVEALVEARYTLEKARAEGEVNVDLAVEGAVARFLKSRLSKGLLITEESGIISWGGGGPPYMILDPIDGTTNMVRGYPCYSSSLAVASSPTWRGVEAGAVINLVSGEIFKASRGSGAYRGGELLRPSRVDRLAEAAVAVDLNLKGVYGWVLDRVAPILRSARHVRCMGTDALEICMVASGALEAFIDLRGILRLTDFAAAVFIAEEAGAISLDGEACRLNPKIEPEARSSVIVCGNQAIAEEILKTVGLGKG